MTFKIDNYGFFFYVIFNVIVLWNFILFRSYYSTLF